MTDPIKTCTNCGHSQPTGDFCETCGTRLPAAVAGAAAPAGVTGAAPSAPTPPPYAPPPQYGATQPGAPQYGAVPTGAYQPPQAPYASPQYATAPRPPRDDVWGGLGDFAFRRFPTPGLVGLAWILALIWAALSLIVSIWVISDTWGGGRSVFMLLQSVAVAVFTVLLVRVGLEAALALHRIREKKE